MGGAGPGVGNGSAAFQMLGVGEWLGFPDEQLQKTSMMKHLKYTKMINNLYITCN